MFITENLERGEKILLHFKVKTKATNQECGRIHGAPSTFYKQSDPAQGKLRKPQSAPHLENSLEMGITTLT